MQNLVTIKEAYTYLNVSRDSFFKMMNKEPLKSLRIELGKKNIRFKKEDIDNYIESCRRENGKKEK